MALHEREKTGKGQVVDVALYEAVFNCMESLLPEYDRDGYVRERSGSALPGIAPSNLYPCKDGYVLIGGNADSLYQRLMTRHRPRGPARRSGAGEQRRARGADGEDRPGDRRMDFAALRSEEVLAVLEKAEVPAGASTAPPTSPPTRTSRRAA